MNRRTFFSSILGVPAALAAVTAHAARPTDPRAMVPCQEGHEPAEGYVAQKHDGSPFGLYAGSHDVLALHTQNDGYRVVVPCRKCGVMFALKR